MKRMKLLKMPPIGWGTTINPHCRFMTFMGASLGWQLATILRNWMACPQLKKNGAGMMPTPIVADRDSRYSATGSTS